MLHAIFISDPFDPFYRNAERVEIPGVSTVRQLLTLHFGVGFGEFEHPTLCLVNGEPWMRKQWDEELPEASIVTFVRLAQGIVELIIALIVVVVAVVIALTFISKSNAAAIGADQKTLKNGAPVYTLTGQTNQNKLNSPIECIYGYNRVYPSIAASSYNVYDGNDQYQYSLYCVGHGYFNLTYLRLEDSNIQQFDGATYQICDPGVVPSLVNADVHTSTDLSNVTLYGPDEDQYQDNPTPYTVCDVGEQVTRIEVDLSLPQGLYVMDDTGKLQKTEVKVVCEYQLIDDFGDTLGSWNTLFSWSQKLKTVDPQRYTVATDVTLGRYQVRARRTNKTAAYENSDDSGVQSSDAVQWEELRGFSPFTADFGDVTLIAVKLKATNQLNSNSSQRFNVMAQRLLPVWDPNLGWQLEPTRSIVWAFCDVFMANYGARLGANLLDLNELFAIDQYFSNLGQFFDYIFDQSSTVWDAAKAICAAGRAIPMLAGSQLTIIIDMPKTTATAVFNMNNIIAGSFQWSIKLPTVAQNDGLEITYMDETTWVEETVTCLIGDDQGDFPETQKLPGVTNRDRAFRIGMYMRAVELFQNEAIQFDTGLEGHLPSYGDMILVQHDVPEWGQGGRCLGYTPSLDEDENQITTLLLDNKVTFVEGQTHKVILRMKDGSAWGPVTATAGADANHVVIQGLIDETFYFDDIHEPPYFLFGVQNILCKRVVVVGIQPQEDDKVTIQGAAYDERLYQYDTLTAPPLFSNPTPITIPGAPVVGALSVSQKPGQPDFLIVYWQPVVGAQYYTVETSVDNVTWTLEETTTVSSATFQVGTFIQEGGAVLYVRVSATNTSQGPWSNWSGYVNSDAYPTDVTGVKVYGSGPGYLYIDWDYPAATASYDIVIIDTLRNVVILNDTTTNTNYSPAYYNLGLYGLSSRLITFGVRARSAAGTSPNWTYLNATFPPTGASVPAAPVTCTADMYYYDLTLLQPLGVDANTFTIDKN